MTYVLAPTARNRLSLVFRISFPGSTRQSVDTFCEQIDYAALDFKGKFTQNNCRLCFHAPLLLRLYIYGYLNGTRSSRKLEGECRLNLELMWLFGSLVSMYLTITDFLKRHAI